jgi:vitamin B12 transporter
LSVLPEVIYVGRRGDVRYDDSGAFLGAGRVKSYTLVNLSANYAVTEQVTTFVRMRNLLDREYEPANGFAAPGFNALAGVRVQF